MKSKQISALVIVLTLGTLANESPTVEAFGSEEEATTVISGLNGPMGVLVTADGHVWVIDTGIGGDEQVMLPHSLSGQMVGYGTGESAQIVRLDPEGGQTKIASLPSWYFEPGIGNAGGARLAVLDGTVYATVGGFSEDLLPSMASVVRIDDGRAVQLASAAEFESTTNPDGLTLESNPYALAVGPDGKLWMIDAAGNTLIKVDPRTGQMELVAVFEGVPSPIPHPTRGGVMETDPVPTGVAFDDEGNAYVSLLPGIPLAPGSAKVVRVDANGGVSDYATGLTMLTDIRRGPDGFFYVVSFGEFTEQGPVPDSGAILRVKEGTASEQVVGQLSFPTSIDFNATGDAYVSINGIGPPGTGEVVMYKGLASGIRSEP
jgi:DNA-binding beta-propeller fold protein YncE